MRKFLIGFFVIIVVLFGFFLIFHQKKSQPIISTTNPTIHVVAAENFYGDIVKQLGGEHVSVTSILSDPNVDPHEYESNVQDAIALSNANIVIENGLSYDTWIDKLLLASPNKKRIQLIAGEISPHKLEDNPHVWYGVDNVSAIAQAITDALKKTDPADAAIFDQNLATFNTSLQPIQQKIAALKNTYNGTPIGLTETIYLYQTQPMGLKVLTPFAFEKAIAEGNDPSAADVITTDDQIAKKQIQLLIFNSQTVTPITTNLQKIAQQSNIPVVTVSETMPQNKTYQSWMLGQLSVLEQVLQQTTKK